MYWRWSSTKGPSNSQFRASSPWWMPSSLARGSFHSIMRTQEVRFGRLASGWLLGSAKLHRVLTWLNISSNVGRCSAASAQHCFISWRHSGGACSGGTTGLYTGGGFLILSMISVRKQKKNGRPIGKVPRFGKDNWVLNKNDIGQEKPQKGHLFHFLLRWPEYKLYLSKGYINQLRKGVRNY